MLDHVSMFFRLKETKSGQVLKLIESYRDDVGRPRHRTVASLGNAGIARSQWKFIAKAVEARLYGQRFLFPEPDSEEDRQWIDRIVRQVSSEARWTPSPGISAIEPIINGVLIDRVTHTDSAELGPVLVGWTVWQRLGMPELLAGLGFNRSQQHSAGISIINRLVEPTTEHRLLDWYRCSGLPELMGNRLRGAGDDRFYRVSDQLLDHQQAIERHLRNRQRSLFNLDRTVLLYDLTNSHFEGACRKNPKAKRGINKQKRNDCPQIVVGMVFDQFGFEMAHKIFEGTMNDGRSLLSMIAQLKETADSDIDRPLVIMDGGIATRKNLNLLREHGFSYLVNDSRRKRKVYQQEFREEDSFSPVPGREAKPEVLVRVLTDPHPSDEIDWDERVVLCKSDQRRKKEDAIISKVEKRFLDALGKLATRIERGRLKDPEKIQRAIGRIQAKHARVQRYYQVALDTSDNCTKLIWSRRDILLAEAQDLLGCYVLRTDQQTLDEHELWPLYIALTHAENGFRALKTDLGLRPNPHQIESRVDAHVFICVLAYHLLRHILWTLELKGDHRNWDTLKQILQTHSYTTVFIPTHEGSIHRIRKAGQPDERQKAIYRALDVEWRGLPANRTVIQAAPNAKRPYSASATL